MQTNPDFSKLINTLDTSGASTQFAMGSDGTVQVVTKRSDGVVTYVVNGVVVWNGCAYATCAVQPIPSDSIPYSAEISEVAKSAASVIVVLLEKRGGSATSPTVTK